MADSRETGHKDASFVVVCDAITAIRAKLDRNRDYISKETRERRQAGPVPTV